MAEWVVLQPIFEVCANETGYRGEGRHRETWWRQAVDEKHLRDTLEDIFAASRNRRRPEYGWCGGGEGGEDDSDSEIDG